MAKVTIFLLCSFFVVFARESQVKLAEDRPWLRVKLSDSATLKCCYTVIDESNSGETNIIWIKRFKTANNTYPEEVVMSSDRVFEEQIKEHEPFCGKLIFKSVQLNDTGLYQCRLNVSTLTHGTYLQVYKPIEKTINLSESTKNKILTAEGILLILCVLVPSATLLSKSRKLHELEKKKVTKEEENIYQGLNLDDCCTTYDQIERSQQHGPYQDVGNIMEDDEEIQLEKP